MKSESPRGIKRFPSRNLSSDYDNATQRSRTSTYGSGDWNSDFDYTPLVNQFRVFGEHFNSGENQFNSLPIEATLMIFSHLNAMDLLQARLASKEWCSFADDELLWKNLCYDNFRVEVLYGDSWKATYAYLDDLFSDGEWEGMSKWVEPAGFDNEQKTTARLHFLRRNQAVSSPTLPRNSSPATIRRVDSSVNATETKVDPFKDAEFRIIGSGITFNCSAPSKFHISGERTLATSTGSAFKWNKHFDKHTSVYEGQVDYAQRIVSGTITYHDGITHWKGMFYYTKSKNTPHTKRQQKMQVNA